MIPELPSPSVSTPPPRPRLRLFVALLLEPVHLRDLQKFQRRLREMLSLETIRWCDREQLHLTLKFLGYVRDDQLAALQEALRQAAAGIPPFELRIERAGGFPNLSRPRVIWADVQASSDFLLQLQRQIEAATARFAQKEENRPFHPHLTLARIKDPIRLPPDARQFIESAQAIASQPWMIRRFVLMKSTLLRSGAMYSPLSEFQLR